MKRLNYSQMYLTFEAIESGTFKFSGATSAHTLSYSLDDGTTWTSLAHNTNTPTINAGNKIMWKGDLTPQDYKGIGKFVATGKFDVYGNIMSLLYEDDFVGQISLEGNRYAFSKAMNRKGEMNKYRGRYEFPCKPEVHELVKTWWGGIDTSEVTCIEYTQNSKIVKVEGEWYRCKNW